jgi:hypothetical protein
VKTFSEALLSKDCRNSEVDECGVLLKTFTKMSKSHVFYSRKIIYKWWVNTTSTGG